MDKIHLHIVKWHLYHKLIGIFSHSAVEILPKSFELIPSYLLSALQLS